MTLTIGRYLGRVDDQDEGFSGGVLVAALAALLFFACLVAIVAFAFRPSPAPAHNAPARVPTRAHTQPATP